MRNLTRNRAERAYWEIDNLLRSGENLQEFTGRVKRLPGLIRRSGLLGVAVYGYAKEERRKAVLPIFERLQETKHLRASPKDPNAVIKELIKMDARSLMLATQEAFAFADWLAKMASALIPEEKQEESNEAN